MYLGLQKDTHTRYGTGLLSDSVRRSVATGNQWTEITYPTRVAVATDRIVGLSLTVDQSLQGYRSPCQYPVKYGNTNELSMHPSDKIINLMIVVA